MQDAHVIVNDGRNLLCGVFDGHGGAHVAEFCAKRMVDLMKSSLYYKFGGDSDFEALLLDIVNRMEEQVERIFALRAYKTGTTCLLLHFTQDYIHTANVGDSRAVLCRDGTAIALTQDHKPHFHQEYKRIRNAGGSVQEGRINGKLSLSRAIGDFHYKQNLSLEYTEQMVTSHPDIHKHKLEESDEFVLMACDGIWDCISNQDAVDFVRRRLHLRCDTICELLIEKCLAPSIYHEPGCDNMTVILIKFKNTKRQK